IVPEETCFRVTEIETDHLVERGAAPPRHLPKTGDPRLRIQNPPVMPGFVLLELVRNRGPRTNEGHFSAQYVPQLGQLVEARLTQNPADGRDARVCGEL